MHADPSAIIREYAPFVWRVLRHLGVREDQLEDVAQEVFLVVFQKLPGFEGRSSLRTWIYGICRNLAAVARRETAGRKELSVVTLPETSEPAVQDRELWLKEAHAQLVHALDGLDDEQRAVFVLYEIEELSIEEIARALQTPITTCYSRLYAARSKLESALRRRNRTVRVAGGGAR